MKRKEVKGASAPLVPKIWAYNVVKKAMGYRTKEDIRIEFESYLGGDIKVDIVQDVQSMGFIVRVLFNFDGVNKYASVPIDHDVDVEQAVDQMLVDVQHHLEKEGTTP